MTETSISNSPDVNPIKVIFLTLLTVLLGFVIVGPLVGAMVAMPFYDGNFMDLAEALQNPTAHPEIKTPLYIMQGRATFVGLIVGPSLLLLAFRRSAFDFFKNDQFDLKPIVLNNFNRNCFCWRQFIFLLNGMPT